MSGYWMERDKKVVKAIEEIITRDFSDAAGPVKGAVRDLVSTDLATPGSDVRAAVVGVTKRTRNGTRIAFVGDSRTAIGGEETDLSSTSRGIPGGYSLRPTAYHAHLVMASGGKLLHDRSYGGGGYTSTQIRTDRFNLLMARADLAGGLPDAAMFLCWTNDIAAETSLATVKDDLTYMWETSRESGMQPIATTELPRDGLSGSEQTYRDNLNAWIRLYCDRNAIRLVDFDAEYADTDGSWLSSLTSDGIHPTAAGAKTIGEWAAGIITAWPEFSSPYIGPKRNTTLGFANSLFLTDAVDSSAENPADGIPDSLTLLNQGTGQATSETDATFALDTVSGWAGNALTITGATGGGVSTLRPVARVEGSPGDLFLFSALIQTENMTGGNLLISTSSTTTNVNTAVATQMEVLSAWDQDNGPYRAWCLFPLVGDTAAGARFDITPNTFPLGAVVTIGEVELINLTANGLAD